MRKFTATMFGIRRGAGVLAGVVAALAMAGSAHAQCMDGGTAAAAGTATASGITAQGFGAQGFGAQGFGGLGTGGASLSTMMQLQQMQAQQQIMQQQMMLAEQQRRLAQQLAAQEGTTEVRARKGLTPDELAQDDDSTRLNRRQAAQAKAAARKAEIASRVAERQSRLQALRQKSER